MSVQYTEGVGWHWTCLFGCADYGYEGEHTAREAFVEHDCVVS